MTRHEISGYELRASFRLDAPRDKVWRCWTEPRLLEQWFHPESWTTEVKALELYSGGASHIIMRGPDGELSEGLGVFLEALAKRRLVFTNAYRAGWIPVDPPAGTPHRTMIIEMSDEDDKTRYLVRALHWTEDAMQQHKAMGFHNGWEQTAARLEAMARAL